MILYILIAETSTKFKKNLKKYFDILENWFYENYTFLYPRKCEFKGFGKTNENEVFTYHEIRLKKSATKKLLGITIDEHLNFNEHLTNVCKRANRKLNALSRVSSFLSYQQKKVMSNSFVSGQFNYCPLIWMFSSIRLTEKSINYMRSLYVYAIIITPQAMTNFQANRTL